MRRCGWRSRSGREHRVLFDTGISPNGLIENVRRLEVSPHDVGVIVLSHGHFDHTTGMDGLIRTLGKVNLPVLIDPEFWSRRRAKLLNRSDASQASKRETAGRASTPDDRVRTVRLLKHRPTQLG